MVNALYTSDGDIVSNGESLKLFGDVCGVTIGDGVLFSSQILPILANLGYFVANLRTFCRTFTGQNNAVVSQN